MGVNYNDLDKILIKMENNESILDEQQKLVEKVKGIVEAAKYREIKNIHMG